MTKTQFLEKEESPESFDFMITPERKWYDLRLAELFRYRDLILLFVKRSFTAQYKQTILGPAWYFISPLITSFVSTIIFGNIARIESDGIPYFLFYLCGYTLWNYFSSCVNNTASTFTRNAAIMGKVYFPRLTMPISSVIYAAVNMLIVFFMTLITIIVYTFKGYDISPNWTICLIPLYMLQTALTALGVGIIISSLTTKYRDLNILVGFGLSLWMYLTPVVYPLTAVKGPLRNLIMLNPMAPVIHNFKYALLGTGGFDLPNWMISIAVMLLLDFIGLVLFNQVEKTFMDTV